MAYPDLPGHHAGMLRALTASSTEVLAGLVDRVTFHNPENGFCVLRVKTRGQRDLITVVGRAAMISAGEFVQVSGGWASYVASKVGPRSTGAQPAGRPPASVRTQNHNLQFPCSSTVAIRSPAIPSLGRIGKSVEITVSSICLCCPVVTTFGTKCSCACCV